MNGPMRRTVNRGEKPKNIKGVLGDLWGYVKPFLPGILLAVLCAVAGAVLTIIGPDKLKNITDLLTESLYPGASVKVAEVVELCVTLLILYLCSALFSYIQGFVMATVTQKTVYRMRDDMSRKINRLPLKYFDGTTVGDVLSRMTNDVDMIGQTLNMSVGSLVGGIVLFFGAMIMMFVTNYIMAFAAIGATLIGFLFMGIIMKHSQKYFLMRQEELGKLNGHIEESYSGHNVLKAYNGEANSCETFEKINQKVYESAWKSQFLSGLMMPFMGFVGNLGYVAVCVVGGALTISGKISFGVVVAFMVYIRLFTQPLSQIAQAATSLQSAAAAGERAFGFLKEKEMETEEGKTQYLAPEKVRGNVEFEHVNFGYDAGKTVINDFSVHVTAGQKVAIVGPTGAGKTTMVNLLMRFYELNGGKISIDGIPVSDLTRENVHALFGMVLQDTWLMRGTVRENIAYGKQVTDGQLDEVCKAVGLNHYISTLPQGYDTVLDGEANLSAGQKQLITIARAMAENAPLLILDEATSSVDTRTEAQIQQAMDRLTEGRTSFIIAHRLSTIRNAELILVMQTATWWRAETMTN